jgi:hypothetical protein
MRSHLWQAQPPFYPSFLYNKNNAKLYEVQVPGSLIVSRLCMPASVPRQHEVAGLRRPHLAARGMRRLPHRE